MIISRKIVEKYRVEGKLGTGEIPEELRGTVQSASDECPIEIIHVG